MVFCAKSDQGYEIFPVFAVYMLTIIGPVGNWDLEGAERKVRLTIWGRAGEEATGWATKHGLKAKGKDDAKGKGKDQ